MGDWSLYITDYLLGELEGGGQLQHAAILGKDGALWAQSENFPEISDPEFKDLIAGLHDLSKLKGAFMLGGDKYMLVASEPDVVLRGKKGPGGVTIKATETGLVIGIYGEGVTPGDCNKVVEGLGDYLINQGL